MAFTWTNTIGVSTKITAVQATEIKTKLDWLKDNLACLAHNTGVNTSNLYNNYSSYDSSYDGDNNANYYSGYDGSYYSSNYTAHDSGNNSTYNSGYDSSNYSTDNSTVLYGAANP